jgi:hypothetical protein
MKTGVCRFCGHRKELAQAHIIPRSFFLLNKGDSKHFTEARQYDDRMVKNWQNGVWDDGILCSDCDNGFSSWEKHGIAMLSKPPGTNALPENDSELESFVLHGADYAQLKLFVLTMLWRASISTQPFFAKIELGKHEATIVEMLRNKDPGSPHDFAVVVHKLVGLSYPRAVFAPCTQRSPEGINFALVFLPSLKIVIKVDRRPTPQILEPLVLKPDSEIIAWPMLLQRNELQALNTASNIFREWLSRRNRQR